MLVLDTDSDRLNANKELEWKKKEVVDKGGRVNWDENPLLQTFRGNYQLPVFPLFPFSPPFLFSHLPLLWAHFKAPFQHVCINDTPGKTSREKQGRGERSRKGDGKKWGLHFLLCGRSSFSSCTLPKHFIKMKLSVLFLEVVKSITILLKWKIITFLLLQWPSISPAAEKY